MIFKFIFTIAIIILSLSCYAQENQYQKQSLSDRKVGIYANYEEFLSNQPSITKAFKVVPIFYVSDNKKDSMIVALTYKFLDSSKLIKKIWGLFDGEKTYYHEDDLILIPFSYTGRYSMVVSDTGTQIITYNGSQSASIFNGAYSAYSVTKDVAFGIMGIGVSLIDNLLAKKTSNNKPIKITTKRVSYINRKGELMGASDQAIGFFLKNEKDLSKAFDEEKKPTADIYIKYIMAMNARYPL